MSCSTFVSSEKEVGKVRLKNSSFWGAWVVQSVELTNSWFQLRL